MRKTIYNVYVPMESQEQCDRMRQLCIDNGLTIGDHKDDFKFSNTKDFFRYSTVFYEFGVWDYEKFTKKLTEQEFIELLKKEKDV
jgi:hypothetical protein